jgi:hypothetical protein
VTVVGRIGPDLSEDLALAIEARNPDARVYVAGASSELGRAKQAMRAVRRVIGDDAITYDWSLDVRRAIAAGVPDHELSVERAAGFASRDVAGVELAGLLWILASDAPSRGMWVELGIALGLRRRGHPIEIVVSGLAKRPTVFAALADHICETDTGGLYACARWARDEAINGGTAWRE